MINDSLSVKNYKLSLEWHPFKNNGLKPNDVSCGSNKKVWWKCSKKGHEWEATINNRNSGRGCPYCSNQFICKDNCLSTISPRLARQWHPTKNEGLNPDAVGAGSVRKVWWLCPSCNSDWLASISGRHNGRGCPYCSGRKVNNKNCFAIKNSKMIKEWDFSKNTGVSPFKITNYANKKVWWKCKNNHSWAALVSDRTGSDKTGCPYCDNRRIDKNNCLAKLNPNLSKEWNYKKNKGITPLNVGANSYKKVWWKCRSCDNEWLASIMYRNNGFYKCKRCNSLAKKYPELIREWDFNKNKLDPYFTASSANVSVWWKCKNGHEWMTKISCRTNGKTNCPYCRRVVLKDGTVCDSYVESFLYLQYKKQNAFFKHNKKYGDGFGKHRYDFYFPKLNKYVEVTSTNPSWIKLVGQKRWEKYIKTINKKRKFVENKLNGKFEFIQMNLNNEQMSLVRKNMA